ncbi:hypothetical protein CGMCC3_g15873 [Colletotrichum fructicola]|nr:uncharacterized protein CGMCC3_g15873 [Colletotrichum fructicola]KAE9568024.1 hypothetical protein CGMCC3_g15873 [Colletotrichum fructicola]
MPMFPVQPNDHVHLHIANLFNSVPKIVTITGAGISTMQEFPTFDRKMAFTPFAVATF